MCWLIIDILVPFRACVLRPDPRIYKKGKILIHSCFKYGTCISFTFSLKKNS